MDYINHSLQAKSTTSQLCFTLIRIKFANTGGWYAFKKHARTLIAGIVVGIEKTQFGRH